MPRPPSSPDWTVQSEPTVQTAVGASGVCLGLAVALGAWRLGDAWTQTTFSAFVLGLLVLVVSSIVLVQGGRQVVSVDPARREIEVLTTTRWSERRRVVPFEDVDQLFLGQFGDREGGSVSYYVCVRLRSGEEVSLYVGAFEGTFDRPTMEARLQRLQTYLNAAGA